MFGLFSSCSAHYRKVQSSRLSTDLSLADYRITTSVIPTTPETPDLSEARFKFKASGLVTPDKEHVETPTIEHRKISLDLSKTFSTPESSQTDSDDVSPQIQRKRRSGHSRDMLPRFSISIEDEHSRSVTVSVKKYFFNNQKQFAVQ